MAMGSSSGSRSASAAHGVSSTPSFPLRQFVPGRSCVRASAMGSRVVVIASDDLADGFFLRSIAAALMRAGRPASASFSLGKTLAMPASSRDLTAATWGAASFPALAAEAPSSPARSAASWVSLRAQLI